MKKHIRIEVDLTPAHLDEMQLKDKNIVVIDVLRASTTIAVALKNGAKEIIPVSNIESAVKVSGSLFGDVTLRAGERNARMIEGFNLGNSPKEYTEEIVRGKSIIFLTTNGSGAMAKGRHAKNLVVGGFVNISMVVRFLRDLQSDFIIVCAGKDNMFCIEDTVCAGRLINLVQKETDADFILDDAGKAAAALDRSMGRSLIKLLKDSEHGRYLISLGFGDDLKLCADIDSVPVLPILTGNVIRAQDKLQKRAG